MPQDVYNTPLVSMLEPMVEGFDASIDNTVSNMNKETTSINQQWSQAIQQFQSLESGIASLGPSEAQVIQQATMIDSSPEVKHVHSLKMQMQDDLVAMTEKSNVILILGFIFLFSAMLFLLVSFV